LYFGFNLQGHKKGQNKNQYTQKIFPPFDKPWGIVPKISIPENFRQVRGEN